MFFLKLSKKHQIIGLITDNNYSENELKFNEIANALSRPARKKILELIQEKMFVTQARLPQILNLNKTSVQRHVNSLRRAQLIDEAYYIHFSQLLINWETLNYFHRKIEEIKKP